MAIGLDMPPQEKIHQHVVWGADYDEGYVKGVYYVNPNDFSQHSGTADGEQIGLLYMEIVCLEDGGTYTESSVPGSYMPIQRIEVCTIGQTPERCISAAIPRSNAASHVAKMPAGEEVFPGRHFRCPPIPRGPSRRLPPSRDALFRGAASDLRPIVFFADGYINCRISNSFQNRGQYLQREIV